MNAERDILVKRLLEAGFDSRRFLKLGNKGNDKAAKEPDFQNHLYTPEELGDYPLWGICGRNGLVLVDADKVSMEATLRQILPPTFEVRSPRRGLAHFYYAVEGEQVENKVLSLKGEEEKAGEIRAKNMYLVAPGTEIHYKDLRTSEPKIGRYTILQDRPLAKINHVDFMAAVTPYLGSDPKQPITFEQMRKGVPQGSRHLQGIKLANYLTGLLKFDEATALYAMQGWNKLCTPPMDNADLERMVKNALGYVATKRKKRLVRDSERSFEKKVANLE